MAGAIPLSSGIVLLYGGAFDPPHRAHVELPCAVREILAADLVLYVPAASPPLKAAGPVAGAQDRLDMLRAALDGQERLAISDVEIQRGGASFTIDTLSDLRRRTPASVTFRLLIGADRAVQFHRWRKPREILELAEPVVMIRPPMERVADLLEAMRPHWTRGELDAWGARFVPVPPLDVSSTRLRQVIREHGPDAEEARRWIPGRALDIIRERGLYRS